MAGYGAAVSAIESVTGRDGRDQATDVNNGYPVSRDAGVGGNDG